MNCDRRKKNPLSNSLSTTGNQVITIQKVTLAGLRRITPPLSSSIGGTRKATLSPPTTDRAGAGGSGGDDDEATFIQHFADIPDREHVKASLVKLREVLYTTKSGYALLDYDDGGAKEATAGNAGGGGAQGDGSTRSDGLMSSSSSTISLASVDNDSTDLAKLRSAGLVLNLSCVVSCVYCSCTEAGTCANRKEGELGLPDQQNARDGGEGGQHPRERCAGRPSSPFSPHARTHASTQLMMGVQVSR